MTAAMNAETFILRDRVYDVRVSPDDDLRTAVVTVTLVRVVTDRARLARGLFRRLWRDRLLLVSTGVGHAAQCCG